MTTRASDLASRIAEVLAIDSDANAIEFEQRWHSWGQLDETSRALADLIQPGTDVGILLRNRPASVGLLLGVLRARGCVVTINPGRGDDRTRADIASLGLTAIAGEPDDLDRLVAAKVTATRIAVSDLGAPLAITPCGGVPDPVDDRSGVAVRMLTSGTTGPPKRVDLTAETLERVLVGAKHYESAERREPQLRRGIAVVNSPLVHLGGLFRVLQCVSDGRSFCLLERFGVDAWADAVRRHRPATASLVPAALRMVLESDLDAEDLSSLRSVVSGTAPLDPDDADAFTERFGVPVLISYAATEFGGAVAGWNGSDHQKFWAAKRGSVGRAHSGCEVRVVDAETGSVLGADAEGLLEVNASQTPGVGWVRTTDLARVDADGFLWILGRADQAIIRGGFKIIPDDVRAALERLPDVKGAAVVGRADQRLGEVPVAMVELWEGATADQGSLTQQLGVSRAAYEVPVSIRIVDELPRTDSAKPDLRTVAALMNEEGG